MIRGLGTDIVRIDRIDAALARHGERFAQKILGPEELAVYRSRAARHPPRGRAFLATRFAAKEAVSKAIGLGIRWPMTWRAAQILNDAKGRPIVVASGELAEWLTQQRLTLHITLTDEHDVAVAFAVAEQLADAFPPDYPPSNL
ncbi:MAG: holo-ACP synthase [Janthinobacterium lividum]